MNNAYVLLTAMPPTKGHLHLIQFARNVAFDWVHVMLNTQPGEPYPEERADALKAAIAWSPHLWRTKLHHVHETIQQNPSGPDDTAFWDMWRDNLQAQGCGEGDFIVASEMYGAKLAEITGATFVPYDIDRSIYNLHATQVRENPRGYFYSILPAFQPVIRKRITFFGAESVGKTTTSRYVAGLANGHWLPEWARPYMERFAPEVDRPTMEAIWQGQRALQKQGLEMVDKPFIFQDTDLFSTVGYWRLYEEELGSVPQGLINNALTDKSDLYIILTSDIPFEADPLRFGGDVRESTDQFWIQLCEEFGLNYQVVPETGKRARKFEAYEASIRFFDTTAGLAYQREVG